MPFHGWLSVPLEVLAPAAITIYQALRKHWSLMGAVVVGVACCYLCTPLLIAICLRSIRCGSQTVCMRQRGLCQQ